jgi:hypothetical protein
MKPSNTAWARTLSRIFAMLTTVFANSISLLSAFRKRSTIKPGTFSLRHFYVVTSEEIRVLALLHASRDTETVLTDRRNDFPMKPL